MRSANLMNIDYQHYYIFSGLIMRVDLICRWKATKIGYIQHCVVVVINVGKHTKKILFLLAKLKDNFFDLFILLFTMLLTAKINRKTCIEMKDLGHVFFFCISLQITSFNIFNFTWKIRLMNSLSKKLNILFYSISVDFFTTRTIEVKNPNDINRIENLIVSTPEY